MKELIKMQPNYSIEHCCKISYLFISVCNYFIYDVYEIFNYGFMSKEELLLHKREYDIGCWQPKGTKEKELKSK